MENPYGFWPNIAMQLDFGLDECGYPESELIGVVPARGEACTVVVNLDPPTSSAISTSFSPANIANAVWIRVTANPFAGPARVDTVLTGEWHATGLPLNNQCDATNANYFSVPISIREPLSWTIARLQAMPQMFRIDTHGISWGLRASDSLSGPWYNVGLGSNFVIKADMNAQFYRMTRHLGSAVGGIITDGTGKAQSGISLDFPYGGLGTTTFTDGSFSLYGLPRGTNIIGLLKPITFTDPTTGSNRTEKVGLNIEVPASNPTNIFYKMLQFQVSILWFPLPACNCTPWCAIGTGTIEGGQTPVFYAGGAIPPNSGPADCGQVQVTVTPPNGPPFSITPGSARHQNSGPEPASGTWTVTTTVCGQSKQASITVP